ncbi:sigma-54-dependent transcriptional regulator [Pseudoflavonifractor phocaeensis]|uniref:sigma-54-dependent transcriptional regulator n=1 Tax=Pseudoflavonifractor phocaeensis TaxID=1870988 RepID=UPI00210E9E18|nr:sigma-54-dependent transcriptional regulator [Pseudoflavonifractor phocaeensis]MCQ4864633.1 PrpR N-terminal domain-containing protein [Pseudoflavonifractor phocaeensis]
MRKVRLLCIPPYEGMYNLMTNIAARRSDVELIIHMGNMEDGLKVVREHYDDHIDAVISRGGTAETIRKHYDIPACDIIPSVYDVLRTIRLAESMSERFAVVGFPSIARPSEALCDIMRYTFQVRPIHSTQDCEACLQSLRDEGIRVIVGDMISVTCAQKLGMHGLLVISGLESVEAAIDSAVNMHRGYAAISQRAALLSDLLSSGGDDILVYTPESKLFFSTAHNLPEEITDHLSSRISDVIAQGSLKIVRRSGRTILSIQGRHLKSGGEDYCVYKVAKSSTAALFDKYQIKELSAASSLPDGNPLEYYLGSSETITAIRSACDRYAAMNNPVLIVGARGTGKDHFAHYIYSHSRLKNSSFLMIDMGLLDDKGWAFLMDSDNSPLTDSGLTLYFKRVNAAPAEQQQRFLIYLKNSRVGQANRLFFSYTDQDGSEPRDELYLHLTETMRCLRLQLPTLFQRREDIPALVGLYINAINVQHGTQVIGFTHDAMLSLQNYDWSRNVDQLLQTVRDMIINSKVSYISEEKVQSMLSARKWTPTALHESSIDLDRPLNEIVQDIVLRVYEAEHMNQTHTAKHLGISRSTLWRMLK